MFTLYEIEVNDRKLTFHGMCDENLLIDRLTIVSPHHLIKIGWVGVWTADHLIYTGPYSWFANGGMNFAVSKYFDVKIVCRAFDSKDRWFHGSDVRLVLQQPNEEIIPITYENRFDEYTK